MNKSWFVFVITSWTHAGKIVIEFIVLRLDRGHVAWARPIKGRVLWGSNRLVVKNVLGAYCMVYHLQMSSSRHCEIVK
jgi:hypothetical protein